MTAFRARSGVLLFVALFMSALLAACGGSFGQLHDAFREEQYEVGLRRIESARPGSWMDMYKRYFQAEQRFARHQPGDAEATALVYKDAIHTAAHAWGRESDGVDMDVFRAGMYRIQVLSLRRIVELMEKEPWVKSAWVPDIIDDWRDLEKKENGKPSMESLAACNRVADGMLRVSSDPESTVTRLIALKHTIERCMNRHGDEPEYAPLTAEAKVLLERLDAQYDAPELADARERYEAAEEVASARRRADDLRDIAEYRARSEREEAAHRAEQRRIDQANDDYVAARAAGQKKCREKYPSLSPAGMSEECRDQLSLILPKAPADAPASAAGERTCPTCNGTGIYRVTVAMGQSNYRCTSNGHGGQNCTEGARTDSQTAGRPCPQCNGTGHIPN